jgi:polyhydroxyalkanoate synthesis regulator phasin
MKVLLDIKDSKAGFVMELLKNLPFVKTKPLTPSKAQFLEEVKEAVDNMTLVKRGKLKARPAKELLDEL